MLVKFNLKPPLHKCSSLKTCLKEKMNDFGESIPKPKKPDFICKNINVFQMFRFFCFLENH